MTSKWRDGLTGVVREPMDESSKHGPLGAVVGVGKGLGHLVASAVTGPLSAVRTTTHEMVGFPHEELPHGVTSVIHPTQEMTTVGQVLGVYQGLIKKNLATAPKPI